MNDARCRPLSRPHPRPHDLPPAPAPGGKVVLSWSGGKDSAMALHALQQDPAFEVTGLLTTLSAEHRRISHHGVREELLDAQAAAIGLPVHKLHYGPDPAHTPEQAMAAFEAAMHDVLAQLRRDGVFHVAFGDIDLDEHRAWEERVCAAAGVTAHLPLWRARRREVLDEFWRSGHRCHIVAVDAQKLGRDVLGQELTPELARRFEQLGVDACGENGEFHTVVVDGPRFRYPLRLRFGEVVEHGGYLAIDCACER